MRAALLALGVLLAGCPTNSDPPFADGPTPVDAPIVDAGFPTGLTPEEQNLIEVVGVMMQIQNGLHIVADANGGEYPPLQAAPTPGATCCGAGGVTRCPPQPAVWEGNSTWSSLGVVVLGSHSHVYSISGSASSVTAVARGDRDCDGSTSDISMNCAITAGVERCQMLFPALPD